MIETTKGQMDESVLEKREGQTDTDTETVEWVEYWYENQIVHRSVHVKLKHAALSDGAASSF
jgi:hypothetical protein